MNIKYTILGVLMGAVTGCDLYIDYDAEINEVYEDSVSGQRIDCNYLERLVEHSKDYWSIASYEYKTGNVFTQCSEHIKEEAKKSCDHNFNAFSQYGNQIFIDEYSKYVCERGGVSLKEKVSRLIDGSENNLVTDKSVYIHFYKKYIERTSIATFSSVHERLIPGLYAIKITLLDEDETEFFAYYESEEKAKAFENKYAASE